jgi:hypothetical protein
VRESPSITGGETSLSVHCFGCDHQAVKSFLKLKPWNDMIFAQAAAARMLAMRQPQRESHADLPASSRARGYRE